MKTQILLATLALSASSALAAPLAIEPTTAFTLAYDFALAQARTHLGDQALEAQGRVDMLRAKNEAGQFADFKVSMNLAGGRASQRCEVALMIHRLPLSERPVGALVLEQDTDAGLHTVARNIHVRCQ